MHWFGRTLSLADIDRQSDALAAALVARGFTAGDRLAVYLQNVPQYVTAVLAGWKAGGVVVPVNPMSKARELGYVLDDSGASVIVALESLHRDVVRDVLVGRAHPPTVITTNELDLLDPALPVPPVLAASRIDRPSKRWPSNVP